MMNANSMTARRRLFWFLPLLLVWFVAVAPARAATFINATPVTIPASGPANVYPSTINVSGSHR